MASHLSLALPSIRKLVFGMMLLVQSSRATGPAIVYCSPDLTAGNFQPVYNLYQTSSACQTTCEGSYAYAVLQGSNCWCSDYAPADQESTYSCNTVCPGWPDEWCGNVDAGLYGYFQLSGVSPSGTAGGSDASSSSTTTSSPSVSNTPTRSTGYPSVAPLVSTPYFGGPSSLTVPYTRQSSTRTSQPSVGSTTSTAPVVVPQPSSSSTRSSSSSPRVSSATSTPTEIYTSVTTVTGQVKTILVTPTPTSDSTLGSGSTINSNGGGISTGKVVGIVVGVALGLGLLVGLGVWFWFRRRHQRNLEAASIENTSAHGNTGIPSRQVSQMSSAGLLSKVPRIHTTGFPSGSNPRSPDTMGSNADRRSLGTDQRLNPYAIYAHDESRNSNVSLQDNQDYSRQLRVANPDP